MLANPEPHAPPTLGLMHAAHVLTGFGTLLLGPILPLLAAQWRLSDSQLGLLLLSQFCGATLGGITVSARLSRDLLLGLCAAFLGFTAFAFAPGFSVALPALFLGGFGVGRSIACINILGGSRYTAHRAIALTRLNFTWSLGALLSPLLAALLTPHIRLPILIASFASLFLLCSIALLLQTLRHKSPTPALSSQQLSEPTRLAPSLFLYFAACLFLYGGLETSINAWLTTFAQRYAALPTGQSSLLLGQYTLVLFLSGLTAGRLLAAWLLQHLRTPTLQRLALAISAGLAAALALAHNATVIATLAVLLGIAIAPIFPATFALLMAHRPPARLAGIILAASGLGAAALPSLIGQISTHTGSLQTALTVPVATALALLAFALLPQNKSTRSSKI
jgi:FHS family glucose/mannose:H+ symporter-like MFS transporter